MGTRKTDPGAPEMSMRNTYPSDLNSAEWERVSHLITLARQPDGLAAMHDRREVVNALLYVLRTGGRWRGIPPELLPWPVVYRYFRSWKSDGTLDRLIDTLRGDPEQAEEPPTLGQLADAEGDR